MKLLPLLLAFLSLLPYVCHGQIMNQQSKLFLMQGIWENTSNTENEHSYTIINGMNSVSFVYSDQKNSYNLPLTESKEGFQNDDSGNNDSININSLREDGKYYTVIDMKYVNKNGWIHRPNYLTPEYFDCDGESMSINGGQLIEFSKIKRLPGSALKVLYNKGKFDNMDYIKKYLKIDAKEIKVKKSLIYSEPGSATTMYLIKGDVVTIIEEKDNWIKIEFLGSKLIKGWIKKQDT